MARTVLIDSGVIVALLNRRDQHHVWAKSQFEAIIEPCLSCEAVLSESFFLLEREGGGGERLCNLLQRGVIKIGFSWERHVEECIDLMRRYGDLPMSFADACLVRMAEVHRQALVFTTDSDFSIYRKNGRKAIPLLSPG